MPELEVSLEPHAVASLSVFYGVNSIPDEPLSPSYLSQCHHLDTHSPTPTPSPTREIEKRLSRRKAWERKGKAQKEEMRKKGGKQEKEECCMQQGKGGKEEEEEGKSEHKHSKDIVFRS